MHSVFDCFRNFETHHFCPIHNADTKNDSEYIACCALVWLFVELPLHFFHNFHPGLHIIFQIITVTLLTVTNVQQGEEAYIPDLCVKKKEELHFWFSGKCRNLR